MTTSVFNRAAVSAPHLAAAQAGKIALEAGGGAIEAMVAMAATIAVVYPHMNGLGGDAFWLIREPSGKIRYLEACGWAGSGATIAAYRDAYGDAIPVRGVGAALTVPGAVAGWAAALDFARSQGARLPLSDLLAPALRQAREGYAVSANEARSAPREKAMLLEAPGFAEAFLIDGRWPREGERRKPEALAATLEQMARAGLADFYRGDVARELALDLERIGAPITRSDVEDYRVVWREPLMLALPGVAVFNSPPPTQGLASLMILGMFQRLQAAKAESFEHVHGLIEAAKRAMRIRDRVCADFDRLREDPSVYLDLRPLEREAAAISMTRAAPFPPRADSGDTIWMGAADANGYVVSYIQSVFWEYGSGCVSPRTGVHLQNRGVAFSLDSTSVHALAPRRRPFHTLNPALAVYADGSVMAYGSMGGDGQPQFQAQVFTRVAYGDDLFQAIERPRFLLGRTWGAPSVSLKLEPRFDPSLISALAKAGHDVEILRDDFSDVCGHAGAVRRSVDGRRIAAAHDPRADGGAEGL